MLSPAEADAVARSPVPHLLLLTSISLLLRPLRARDDGSGKDIALWGQCEMRLAEQQAEQWKELIIHQPSNVC